MDNLEGYINFWPEFKKDIKIAENHLCFIYMDKQLLLRDAHTLELPTYKECRQLIGDVSKLWYLGAWKGQPCFAYPFDQHEVGELILEETLSQRSLNWVGFRDPRWPYAMELYYIAVKAQHLLIWDRGTKYCGCCGNLYERKQDDRAKVCPHCGNVQFPRISPAIIVGIKKDNEILMAHNAGFRKGLYSVIAGFVEQGETIEMAVRREVYEEVGIKVKNIRYFQSRPWNSVDSLMLGFIADYESGEIKVDGKEIVDARWCDKAHMPEVLPDKISTAWEIINEIMKLE